MYRIFKVKERVRVGPEKFTLPFEKALKESIEDKFEGNIYPQIGVVLAIVNVQNVGEGKIYPGDGAIFYPVDFEVLSYTPELNELIQGSVIDVTEFGVFVRMGPVDGMVHVSQIMDEFVSYDSKGSQFVGKDTKRSIKEKDNVLARIISVSLERQYKIALTTRQPGLGAPGWDTKKKKAATATTKRTTEKKSASKGKEKK